MRRTLTTLTVAALCGVALAAAPGANAEPLRQLPTTILRPLVLTTAEAVKATGFSGSLSPGAPTPFRCGRQPDNHATYCSRIWDSLSPSPHPTISTAASFTSARAAQAQIRAEASRGAQAGTVVQKSPTLLVYYVTGLPDIGTAAIAQQAIGSMYAYAWCSSAATQPTEPAVQCARDLLAAQAAKIRRG